MDIHLTGIFAAGLAFFLRCKEEDIGKYWCILDEPFMYLSEIHTNIADSTVDTYNNVNIYTVFFEIFYRLLIFFNKGGVVERLQTRLNFCK